MLEIFVGVIGIIIGSLMVWKPRWFLDMVGEQAWAEKVFGAGHGTTAYQTIGIIIIFLSFLIMTGLVGSILGWFFSPVIKSGI